MNADNKCNKIAIISLFHENINYGGVLQAYALRKVVSDMGYSCEQLRYDNTDECCPSYSPVSLARFVKSQFNSVITISQLMDFFERAIAFVMRETLLKFYDIRGKKRAERRGNFNKFCECYVPSSKTYSKQTIGTSICCYDVFISGSDQVWNPNWFFSPYYLSFVPDHIPKISYAASTAVSSLTPEQYERIEPLIKRFQAISVRECNAVSMLQSMTKQKIEWVLDPTLLLSADEWDIISAENSVDEPYVFAYMLGDNKSNQKAATKFAKENGLKLLTFPFTASGRLNQLFFGDIHSYCGPDEWLSLIRDAEYVITDSYHAVIFSIIYRKGFVVLRRDSDDVKESMNSRMYSLVHMFPVIEERIVDASDVDYVKNSVNWDETYCILSEIKKSSINWLRLTLEKYVVN